MTTLSYRALVGHCVAVLDSFNPDIEALEQHIGRYLNINKGLEHSEETFVTEIFSGCVRYTTVLDVVLNGFFNRDGKTVLRSEENLYKVFAYLALFRLDELGVAHYRKFVRSQDVNKMYKFLNFFFDDKHLRTWMKDEWSKLYEHTFVQTTLLSPLLRWLPELRDMVKEMKKKIDNKTKLKKPQLSTTKTQPFNITQPRPRSVPMPEPIPTLKPHMPVPDTTYVEPPELQFMDQIKEANRRKAEERLMEASKIQFACANPEKSEKTKNKMQRIVEDEMAKLDFEHTHANPVPGSMLSENIPIKLNAAAILREGLLYKKREDQELKKIENLEAGAKDGSEFREWQNKMKKMDLDKQLAEIERRRLQGKLSHEEAILARQNLIKENKKKVEEMKVEAQRLMQLYLERKLKEEAEMRKLVENVLDTHENARMAKEKLQEYKAQIVQQVTQESQELMRQALEEAEKEMKQKMDLIREIRAMEAVPVNRNKLVDLTETAGHGLLSEMSIAELRERLCLLDQKNKEEEDRIRDDILQSKQAKDQLLMDTLATISRHRTESSKAAAVRRQEKKANQVRFYEFEKRKKTRTTQPEIKDEKILELQRKLEERREQRKREQEQSKITPDKKSTNRLKELNASKKLLEQNRWKELEQTRERTAKLGSQGVLASQSASRIAGRTMILSS